MRSTRLPHATTLSPWLVRRRTMAAPIPDEPPVTKATRPDQRSIFFTGCKTPHRRRRRRHRHSSKNKFTRLKRNQTEIIPKSCKLIPIVVRCSNKELLFHSSRQFWGRFLGPINNLCTTYYSCTYCHLVE